MARFLLSGDHAFECGRELDEVTWLNVENIFASSDA